MVVFDHRGHHYRFDRGCRGRQAALAQAQQLLPPLENAASSDINQLSQLLAREPGALQDELRTAKPVPPIPAEVRIGLPGDLVRRRPDIRAAEAPPGVSGKMFNAGNGGRDMGV